METMQPTPISTAVFVRLPMATVLGGKTQPIDLVINFATTKENLKLTSIVGIINETEYDMNYLSVTHPQTLVDLVIGNKDKWNENSIWYRNSDSSLAVIASSD